MPVKFEGMADASLKRQAWGGVVDIYGSRIDVGACIVSISPVPKSEDRGTLSLVGNDHRGRVHPPGVTDGKDRRERVVLSHPSLRNL